MDAVYLGTRASYQRQLLELVGLSELPVVEVDKHACLAPERLLVPSTPNQDLMAPHWVVDWLRGRLPASPDLSGYSRGLYVTRGDVANTRRYVEEPELWPALEARGFTRLDPGSVPVREQIDRFAAADVIVAPHGAALANLVFARPGVRVLELFAPDYVNPCYWAITDAVPDARYHYLVAGTPDEITSAEHRPMTGVLRDISIPPARVLTALDRLLSRADRNGALRQPLPTRVHRQPLLPTRPTARCRRRCRRPCRGGRRRGEGSGCGGGRTPRAGRGERS